MDFLAAPDPGSRPAGRQQQQHGENCVNCVSQRMFLKLHEHLQCDNLILHTILMIAYNLGVVIES